MCSSRMACLEGTPLSMCEADEKWNKPSVDFYVEYLKAEPQVEWEGMRLEGDEQIGGLLRFKV